MSDLMVSATFTKNSGQSAGGLTLADIALYLTEVNRTTGADTVIWDGSQNPTEEVANMGAYIRIYPNADLDENNYFGKGIYNGATVLDTDEVRSSISLNNVPIGTAIAFTYTLTNSQSGLPIEGVRVVITTDSAGANPVWAGDTDTFGVARDDNGNLPRLNPGTYFFFRNKIGFVFSPEPDTEVVS